MCPSGRAVGVARGVVLLAGLVLTTGASGPGVLSPAASRPCGDVSGTVLREARGLDDTVTVIRFDYRSGTASRTVVEVESGEVLSHERLPGRPQSSRAEFQEAVRRIGGDARLGPRLARGAVPEGGFIVDGPPGSPQLHRYIQIRLLTPDRRALLKVVLVDLTAGTVASARDSFE